MRAHTDDIVTINDVEVQYLARFEFSSKLWVPTPAGFHVQTMLTILKIVLYLWLLIQVIMEITSLLTTLIGSAGGATEGMDRTTKGTGGTTGGMSGTTGGTGGTTGKQV